MAFRNVPMPAPVIGKNAGGPVVELQTQMLAGSYKVKDLGACPPPAPSPWPYFYKIVSGPVGTLYPNVYLWGTGTGYGYYIGVLSVCGGYEYFYYTYSPSEDRWFWDWAATYFSSAPFTPPSLPPDWTLPPGYSPPPSPSPKPTPTAPPIPLTLTSTLSAFSPNGDGIKDTDSLKITSGSPWTLSIDGQGTVASGPATSADGTTIGWDGTAGSKLSDGSYVLRLHPSDGEPDKTAAVVIDTRPPQISGATVKAASVDANGLITVEGTAEIADQGLAGVNPASITATLVGNDITSLPSSPAPDGSSVSYSGTVVPPLLANGLTGDPHAYRVESVDPLNATTVAINIIAYDKAGNGTGEQFDYQINFPSSANRGMVRSGKIADDPLEIGNDITWAEIFAKRFPPEEEPPAPPPATKVPSTALSPFANGQLWQARFNAINGETVYFDAPDVSVEGSTLFLDDVIITSGSYQSGAIGEGEIRKIIRQIAAEAQAQGFTSLRIRGARAVGPSSTSLTPGAVIDRTIQL